MKLLAIDASTKATGYAIFQNREIIAHGCINASSGDVFKRIRKMVDNIDELLSQYSIEEIVMEEVIPDHTKNTQTFKALMYLQACVMMMLHDKYPRVKIELIYPGSWRAKCGIKTGRGVKRESLKQMDIQLANSTFALSTTSDDIADATLIGAAHINYFNVPQETNEINWE